MRRAGHAGSRRATIADGSTDRTGPGGRLHAIAGPLQQPPRDRGSIGAIERFEDVPLGQRDLGGARAIGGRVRREELAGEALATMPRLHAEREQLLGLAVDTGRSRPRRRVGPTTAAVTRAPSARPASTSAWAACGSAGATTHGASVRPAQVAASTSARIVGVPLAGPAPGHRHGRRARADPPAAVVPDLHEARHQHAPDERRDPGRLLLDGRLRGVEHESGIGFVVEPLGERRLPVPCRLGRPSIAPGRRRRLRDLPMRTGQPGQGPGPRHDPIRVVAAAARREPSATRVQMRDRVHEPGRRPVRGRGHVQVGERIPGVRIGAVLRHDEVGRERGGQFGEQQRQRPPATPARRSRAASGR